MPIATPEELLAIYHEIERQSDRGAGIIAASVTEGLLTEALKKRLILTSTMSERLFSFEKNGPLSNFYNKISIGYAVGLLNARSKNDLDFIRRIRNRFAHRFEPITFANQEVEAWCQTLTSPAPEIKDARRRYLITCASYWVFLHLLAQPDMQIKTLGEAPEFMKKFNELLDQLLHDEPAPSPDKS